MPRKKIDASETANSEFLTFNQFHREIIPWSIDTVKKYIAEQAFPAIRTDGGYVFNRTAVREWFKRRQIQAS